MYSQTTSVQGIDRETKVDIVSTLLDYEIVLRELEITRELLITSNLRNQNLSAINIQVEKINRMLEAKYEITERQLKITQERLKAKGISFSEKINLTVKGAVVGALLTLLSIILLK